MGQDCQPSSCQQAGIRYQSFLRRYNIKTINSNTGYIIDSDGPVAQLSFSQLVTFGWLWLWTDRRRLAVFSGGLLLVRRFEAEDKQPLGKAYRRLIPIGLWKMKAVGRGFESSLMVCIGCSKPSQLLAFPSGPYCLRLLYITAQAVVLSLWY